MIAGVAILVALAIVVAAAPSDLEAQPGGKSLPRVGYLSGSSASSNDEAFRERLRELGYVEGQNLVIEYRYADGHMERLPGLANELVRLDVAVIVAITTPGIRAAQRATQTIPIIMTLGEAAEGTIASIARPGGNTTGLGTINTELTGKRLELLKEALPRLSRIAVLYNPTNPISTGQLRHLEAAARALAVQVQLLETKDAQGIERAVVAAARGRADALMGLPDGLLTAHRTRLADLTIKHRLPTMQWSNAHAQAGSLMSYGPALRPMYARTADYVDRILKGARPADLPIERPTQVTFVINLKTAKALGLTLPQALVLRADQVIQ